MAKFKVGDKVIGNSEADRRYTITRKGWRGVVTKVDGAYITVKGPNISNTPHEFEVIDTFFDPDVCEHKIVITTDGKTTTARLFNGKELVNRGEAICSPDDKFDFMVGAKLAMERLEGNKPKYEVGKYVKVTGNKHYCHDLEIGSYGRIRMVKSDDCYLIDGFSASSVNPIKQNLHPDDFELA